MDNAILCDHRGRAHPGCSQGVVLPTPLKHFFCPVVRSASSLKVLSSSEPAYESCAIAVYKPRLEVSRLLVLGNPLGESGGTRSMIGIGKSSEGAARRLLISPTCSSRGRAPLSSCRKSQ